MNQRDFNHQCELVVAFFVGVLLTLGVDLFLSEASPCHANRSSPNVTQSSAAR